MPIEDVDKHKMVEELLEGGASPGSPAYEYQKAKIQVTAAQDLQNALHDLRDSVDRSTVTSDKLSRRVFWLDVVLAAATVVIAAAAILQLFFGDGT